MNAPKTPVYNTDARCFIGFVAHKSASEMTCESVKKYRKKIEAALRFLVLHVVGAESLQMM